MDVEREREREKQREGDGEEKCEKRIAEEEEQWKKIVSHHLFDCCGF